jgi:PAS domain S-box-containing protein
VPGGTYIFKVNKTVAQHKRTASGAFGSPDQETQQGQAVEDVALINSINEAANRGDSLGKIFELFTRHTIRLFAGFGATVYLLSADKQSLEVQHFELSSNLLSMVEKMLGLKLESLKIPLKPGSLYLNYLKEKKPIIITDVLSIQGFLSEMAHGELEKRLTLLPAVVRSLGIASVISVPLVVEEESIGIIDVASKNNLSQQDLKRLENIARQITLVISRKKMEEQLRWERDFNASLIESSPVLFLALDRDGRTVLMNLTMLSALGYEKQEVTGRNFVGSFVAEPDRSKMSSALKVLSERKESVVCESRVLTKDNRELVIEWHGQCPNPDGRHNLCFAVGIDLTERKMLQEQLIMADRLASMGELVSGVAHELNNPLTGVIGFSELLLEKNIPEDLRENVVIIHHEAQRAAEVVKNMLAFARKQSPSRQSINLNNAIERVLSLRTYEHKVNNIKVITSLSRDLPDIMGDAFQLQQVFLNIIINAEYFMKKTPGGGELIIKTERAGDKIIASIKDNGPGISPENINKIFDPFFSTKEVGAGTGLGLSLSHGIIREHGGRIFAMSKPGEGATFVIELPVPPSHKENHPEPESALANSEGSR